MWRPLALAAAAAVFVAGTFAGSAVAAAPVAPTVEINYQNPVTALPPIARPDTPSCTVTAMQHDFANSYGQPYTGTLTPPAACPGPWSKVVLDWSGSIAGRQYDRLAGVWIGGSEVFRTSTPEPDPAGISWHVDQDISAFTPLLRTPQPLVVDLGNVVDSTYTGTYHMTMTVTYYQTDKHNPEAAHSDVVVPISQSTSAAGWFGLTKGQTATTTVTLPRNTESADLQLYARGGGCEEFWYSNVPDSYAATHSSEGLCAGGTYREVQVLVDGRPAGTAQPFPVIYTGGISPLMWRPIPSIDSFRTQPYDLDLTPFAGVLADGKPHTVTLVPPSDISDTWLMDGSLFVNVDAGSAQTSGAVTQDTITPSPAVDYTVAAQSDGSDLITAAVNRDWTVSGYVDTSHGRITTSVVRHSAYSNSDRLAGAGTVQTVKQRDSGWTQTTTTDGPGLGHRQVRDDTWSYPIDMSGTYVPGANSDSYTADGQVSVARHLTSTEADHGDAWKPVSSVDDSVQAKGSLQRVNGTVVAADGSDSELYLGRGRDGCYGHYIAADHGYVTRDVLTGCR
ncbi:hypothetical protein KGQ20_34795 [Catenulispora sp. NF23]|uniref:Peptide N-acetyl-beta-D-glucosaminyl asparaginase amidase A N-terminal domain-containing protein n=1 Tax=Catenulispora pinistramenti TaxID=2705254 RepID=A0ABS5KV45_9ACTN|nr:peptide-N4-asparagine amidase [Catenulispora pinistramenti]MBS2537934.1 hypothetical protein [Catenulispora pinistramenti]MBS2549926.1 hypothetical protein [Catenulispora pinistramenti]